MQCNVRMSSLLNTRKVKNHKNGQFQTATSYQLSTDDDSTVASAVPVKLPPAAPATAPPTVVVGNTGCGRCCRPKTKVTSNGSIV